MFIYFILLLLSFLLGINKSLKQVYYYAFFALLIFVGAFRGIEVGTDLHGSYWANYSVMTSNPTTWNSYTEMEPLFNYMMAFIKINVNSYQFFYGIVFAFYMWGVFVLLKKYSTNKMLSLFFFILFLYYSFAFNAIRQALALALIMPALSLLTQKQIPKIIFYEAYILLISFGFHRSCIIFAFIPFVISDYVKIIFENNRTKLCIILFVSYFFVFLQKFLYQYTSAMSSIIDFMGDRYVLYMVNSKNSEETISVYSALMNTVMAIYITAIIPKQKLSNIFFIFFIFGQLITNILGSLSTLYIRVGTNFLFFEILLFTELWYCVSVRHRLNFRFLLVVYGLIVFTNSMLKNFGQVVPYTNWLFE